MFAFTMILALIAMRRGPHQLQQVFLNMVNNEVDAIMEYSKMVTLSVAPRPMKDAWL